MFLKGAAISALVAAALAAQADTFETHVLSTSGDFQFSASANYWNPGVNQILPQQSLNIATSSTRAVATVVSDGNALGNYWFAGENWLTFDGTVQWYGGPDPDSYLRVTSQITDLDNNLDYLITSYIGWTGSSWGNSLVFSQPTKRIRWTDQIELVTGPRGLYARWDLTNHTMNMTQSVPEPTSLAAISPMLLILIRRKLTARRISSV